MPFVGAEEMTLYTCTNPACGKTFNNPLKALNLQQPDTEPYGACPFCLTKIEEPPKRVLSESHDTAVEKPLADTDWNETGRESGKNIEKPSACRFHVGYLSERSGKEQIPDDCLVCKDIVDCMLRKMHT